MPEGMAPPGTPLRASLGLTPDWGRESFEMGAPLLSSWPTSWP
jgi:hypothetical protein